MTRINKYLSEQKLATRREADRLIEAGLVYINQRKAVLGDQVSLTDKVTIKKSNKRTAYVYYAYNKPIGIVTSTPVRGEIDIIHHTKFPTPVFPIGRLDKDSHGLILLTNDGRITGPLLEPKYDHEKEYEIVVNKTITDDFLDRMESGVRIETPMGIYKTKSCKVKKLKPNAFTIILTEGKKRQIRKMCEVLGYQVIDLKRIRIMQIKLGTLRPSSWRELTGGEKGLLLKRLGL